MYAGMGFSGVGRWFQLQTVGLLVGGRLTSSISRL